MKKEDLILKDRIVEYNQQKFQIDELKCQELNYWTVILKNGDTVSIISHWLIWNDSDKVCLNWGDREKKFEVLNLETQEQRGYLTNEEVEEFLKEMEE